MKPDYYREKWKKWPLDSFTNLKDEIRHLTTKIALSFLDRYYYNDTFTEDYIDLLCQIATSADPVARSAASSALFGGIIEGLCDDFEELQTEAYSRVMSYVISYCSQINQGVEISKKLSCFGLKNFDDIFKRIERIRRNSIKKRRFHNPEKLIFLSRVTIGADVAVTSVLISRFSKMFPEAEILLIGDDKLSSLFGGNPKIKIKKLKYIRRGELLERINSWLEVLETVENETKSVRDGQYLLIDGDSRLSQLGVLPLVEENKYLYFNSRGKDEYPKKISMAELSNFWVDNISGISSFEYPKIWIPEKLMKSAKKFISGLKKIKSKNIIFINFGVGENPRKRLEGDFEEKLILRLLSEQKTVIILDKGFGEEELLRNQKLISTMQKYGIKTADANFADTNEAPFSHGIIGIRLEIGEAAALISQSSEFIGYDSACQHIAAACSVPTCTIFAGTNDTRFVRRWRAFGPAKSELVHVDTLTRHLNFDTFDIIDRIMDARNE